SKLCEMCGRLLIVCDAEELVERRGKLDLRTPPTLAGIVPNAPPWIEHELAAGTQHRDANICTCMHAVGCPAAINAACMVNRVLCGDGIPDADLVGRFLIFNLLVAFIHEGEHWLRVERIRQCRR